jgi:hypothetical protein
MRGLFHRALVAAAGAAAIWAAASTLAAAAVNAITMEAPRSAGYSLYLPVLVPDVSTGPQDLSRVPLSEIRGAFTVDGVGIDSGFNIDVARVLDQYMPGADAFDGLFYSTDALGSPYLSLASGGSYIGANLPLIDGLHLTFGAASRSSGANPYLINAHLATGLLGGGGIPYDARNASSLVAGLSWNFAHWGGLGLTASQTTEHDGALGLNDSYIDTARTTALGVSAHVGFGGGWVTTASYSEGLTQLALKPGAFQSSDTEIHSLSYGIAVAKHGLFGNDNDALGVAFARPAPSYTSTFSTAATSDMQFFGRDKLFAGTAPETDIELGYVTHFLGNSVALQANASYQMNYGGQNGNNAVSLLSRAKIKF